MAATLGNTFKAYVKISTTYTWLGCEQSNNIDRTQEAIEVSDKSTAWAQFIGGKKGATGQLTVFADNSDSAQQQALKGLYNGVEIDIFLGTLSSNSPTSGEAGKAIITSISDTNDFGAVSTRTIGFTINGALTHYPALT